MHRNASYRSPISLKLSFRFGGCFDVAIRASVDSQGAAAADVNDDDDECAKVDETGLDVAFDRLREVFDVVVSD